VLLFQIIKFLLIALKGFLIILSTIIKISNWLVTFTTAFIKSLLTNIYGHLHLNGLSLNNLLLPYSSNLDSFKDVLYALTLSVDNIMEEKRKIHWLLQCLITESKILYRWHKDAAIKQFTQQQCDNYQNDPKAMIDSLLN